MTKPDVPALEPSAPCPCGANAAYQECCGPLHTGAVDAPTAESLMRSRFAAFVLGYQDYLLRTWHSETRPTTLEPEPDTVWTSLEIRRTVRGTQTDRLGTVTFRASYRLDGVGYEHREVSSFVREDGRWVYRDALP